SATATAHPGRRIRRHNQLQQHDQTDHESVQVQATCRSNRGGITMTDGAPSNNEHEPDTDPRAAAVTFVTTEHFTLQGARSSTIAETTGRATMFLGSVSGGLVALGLIGTAADVGAAFYAFGLILLPPLAFVGLATFE